MPVVATGINWLRQQPLCYTVQIIYCLVRAGLLPQWTALISRALSQEFEAMLAGPDYRESISQLGRAEPAGWSDELTGWPRLRVIVNL